MSERIERNNDPKEAISHWISEVRALEESDIVPFEAIITNSKDEGVKEKRQLATEATVAMFLDLYKMQSADEVKHELFEAECKHYLQTSGLHYLQDAYQQAFRNDDKALQSKLMAMFDMVLQKINEPTEAPVFFGVSSVNESSAANDEIEAARQKVGSSLPLSLQKQLGMQSTNYDKPLSQAKTARPIDTNMPRRQKRDRRAS